MPSNNTRNVIVDSCMTREKVNQKKDHGCAKFTATTSPTALPTPRTKAFLKKQSWWWKGMQTRKESSRRIVVVTLIKWVKNLQMSLHYKGNEHARLTMATLITKVVWPIGRGLSRNSSSSAARHGLSKLPFTKFRCILDEYCVEAAPMRFNVVENLNIADILLVPHGSHPERRTR